jgi:copper chaperone CopZ
MKKTLLVSDMHCSNCAMNIESLEDDLPGVKSISASYQKGQMVVEFDETRIEVNAIIVAVKQKGYTATLA